MAMGPNSMVCWACKDWVGPADVCKCGHGYPPRSLDDVLTERAEEHAQAAAGWIERAKANGSVGAERAVVSALLAVSTQLARIAEGK
jgi:hypothetical protein